MYEKCVVMRFLSRSKDQAALNKLMSDLLGRLEDANCYRAADRVMTISSTAIPAKALTVIRP